MAIDQKFEISKSGDQNLLHDGKNVDFYSLFLFLSFYLFHFRKSIF